MWTAGGLDLISRRKPEGVGKAVVSFRSGQVKPSRTSLVEKEPEG